MGNALILIIDDDQTQHLILGEFLKQSGFRVLHAEEGAKGLEVMEEERPDLILLDIQMPVMDGFETLKSIRSKAEFQTTPVLLLTSLERDILKIKGLELGADDYVTKPFNRDELIARVNASLRRAERNRGGGSMQGDLSDIGLTDLLQSMELGTKTGIIHLPGMDADIHIAEGAFLDARYRQFTGVSGLTRIFLKEGGRFVIRFNTALPETGVEPIPLTSVLMGVLADVDEIKDVVGRIKAENRLLRIDSAKDEFPPLEPLKSRPPMTFIDMIVEMDGDIKENMKTLLAASKKGKLRIVKANR